MDGSILTSVFDLCSHTHLVNVLKLGTDSFKLQFRLESFLSPVEPPPSSLLSHQPPLFPTRKLLSAPPLISAVVPSPEMLHSLEDSEGGGWEGGHRERGGGIGRRVAQGVGEIHREGTKRGVG